jgi:hypothetical protein
MSKSLSKPVRNKHRGITMNCTICEKDVTEWLDLGILHIKVGKKSVCPSCAFAIQNALESRLWRFEKNVKPKRK